MCVIVSKNIGVKMPSEDKLYNCFISNNDGAGYMIANKGKVYIRKGFMTWSEFRDAIKQEGDLTDKAVVMHFRITTQGGVKPHLCHPYPLSKNMDDLKKLTATCEIGVAHNGIIDLTSEYNYGYGNVKKVVDYNDTMKFITDYLSLIIKNKKFYKDNDKITLIERLAQSKFSILDNEGHITNIGDFIEDNGVYYSNSSYQPKLNIRTCKTINDDYEEFYNKETGKYSFVDFCPHDYGDYSYCDKCDYSYCNCSFNDFYNDIVIPEEVEFKGRKIYVDTHNFDYDELITWGIDDDNNWYEIDFDYDINSNELYVVDVTEVRQ